MAVPNALVAEPERKLTFEHDIRPVFKTYCLDCHGGEKEIKGGLDLRLRRFAVAGGDSGPAIAPGKSSESHVIQRLRRGEMPPTEKKVPPEQIMLIEKWIAAGAPTSRDEPEQLEPGIDITPEERAYWFYQPIRGIEPASLPGTTPSEVEKRTNPSLDLVRTPIDAFVLARLRAKGLRFAPDADRATLIRRASLDLLGLPPLADEVDQFVADQNDKAYELLIDKLLESPHYGERWGRHWLDVAGYADSEGNGTQDSMRPYAYKYRDWVIRAFNANMPLDQFIAEQLAGDELVPRPWQNLKPDQIDKLVATGFLATAANPTASGGDLAADANQVIADTIKIVSTSLLGLSVACAQCHDHKYDPIPQADYFRLRAVFEPALNPADWRRPGERRISLYTDADRAKAAEVQAEVDKMQKAYREKQSNFVMAAFEVELKKFPAELQPKLRDAYTTRENKRSAEQKKLLDENPKIKITPGVLYQYNEAAANELKDDQKKIAAEAAEKPPEDFISVVQESPGAIPMTRVFYRGDYRQPKDSVRPGDLTIAASEGNRFELVERDPKTPTTGRRLSYARHLMTGDHPLTGRVLANRIWLHHFGRGIVDTPGEFGILGTRPTHPEMLDWLASELSRQGWNLKKFHKLIMMSTVYRQASVGDTATRAQDADGALCSRYPLRRLEAEVVRDRMLVAAGRLDRTMFGPAVTAVEDFTGQVVVKDDMPRRSVYLQQRRTQPVSLMATFDSPIMAVNCDRRSASTNSMQALMLMNGEFVRKQAGHLAERIRKETPAGFGGDAAKELAGRFPVLDAEWQYGYGAVDETAGRVAEFTSLPHFEGESYRGGPALPDTKIGWVFLRAGGGHPGDPKHAAIRRWKPVRAGTISISGAIKHNSENGDGVRGRVVSSRLGILGTWVAKNGTASAEVSKVEVQAGDLIDFVVDCQANENADSFEWVASVTMTGPDGNQVASWNSNRDFHGPSAAPTSSHAALIAYAWRVAFQRMPTPLEWELACRFVADQRSPLRAAGAKDPYAAAMTNLCQQILISNEFLYVE